MISGEQGSGRAALLTKPVVVVDREGYEAVIAERDFHSTASVRQRVRMILGVFTIAMTAALLGFVGGFWVGQHANNESFKAACSRVVDEAVKDVKCPGANVGQIQDVPADPVQRVRR
ncbi:MAG: hypothetical protein XU15_C0004G0101 [candidate division NC10 bacterium CSP1-5]|nr:MAG: hypothetical protein XU15_C0004G0101 [candidate division NC10 bacterium CSP1-5]